MSSRDGGPHLPDRRSFDEIRRRNERWIAAFVLGVAALFAIISLARLASGRAGIGAVALVVSLGALAFYAVAWWQAGRQAPRMSQALLRTAFEVSVPTAITAAGLAQRGPEALVYAPALIYPLAIFVSALRLRPGLPLVASALAGLEWLTLWWTTTTPESRARFTSLSLVSTLERVAVLSMCGVLAWRLGRSLEALTVRIADTVRQREQVRRAFGAYVAEPVVDRVLSGDLQLTTERRTITVLFVDIRGFTRFSASREPTEVLGRLNQALEAFSVEVDRHGGIVNKFLGDGLMALFGAPLDTPDHARNAARCALSIAAAARRLRDSGVYPELQVGVGIHCGEVVVGDIGGRGHREYTAIGDVVNVASRVEGMNRTLDTSVLVTRAVREAMGEGFALGGPHRVRLRGRDGELTLYDLRGGPDDAPPALGTTATGG
ncbi:MAG: adenylate/guanylate cyclase domain-containing protein [Deltaproteobacteria bacterium]|nr:MAG: adenylate/guanylate cyclase domain-containing protein [Deltaproteobacteria bacterium]